MNSVESRIKAILDETSLTQRSSGELALELAKRLKPMTQIRITSREVRVTHHAYLDNLIRPEEIDNALANQ